MRKPSNRLCGSRITGVPDSFYESICRDLSLSVGSHYGNAIAAIYFDHFFYAAYAAQSSAHLHFTVLARHTFYCYGYCVL